MLNLRSPRSQGVMRCRGTFRALLLVLCSMLFLAQVAAAGPYERARRMHDRLVGIPPSDQVLQDMVDAITATPPDPEGAALVAMQNPVFYTTTLKNWVSPWTNVPQTVFADLNDYTATVIGIVRDDLPFDQVLYGDILYVGNVSPGYSHTDNEHYRELELQRVDLSLPANLARETQSGQNGAAVDSTSAAGIITTRAAGEAFFSAGTNRRMWRFVSMNFLCRDLEDTKDTSRPVGRIRKDVSRSPGGDSSIFLNHCSGCHTGMDPMAGAFAYFNWDDEQMRTVYTPGSVQAKYGINAETFPLGYETLDDSWENYWREGPISDLGWDQSLLGSGFGPQSMGREVASSRAFALCQVEKVFSQVCFRPPSSTDDATAVETIATSFEAGYSMKNVFAEVAAYCTAE
jgi:hypothetical protein